LVKDSRRKKVIKKLYEKSEIIFAIAWIALYVVLASVGDNISEIIGIQKIVTLPILIIMSTALLFFLKRNGLTEKYGLIKPKISNSKMLFYFPLLVLLSANLWFGVSLNSSIIEILLYILSMFCVGFLEEMIFRGLLFKAMAENGIKSAIIVSSITFGIGHIVNLINGSGAEFVSTLLQIVYAVAIGFTFVMIFYKTKSLLPCIITHSVFNSLSVFSNEELITPQMQIISGVLIAIIAGGYALYIAVSVKEKNTK
jgi:membrane protease YdiL (CAAX protease family)